MNWDQTLTLPCALNGNCELHTVLDSLHENLSLSQQQVYNDELCLASVNGFLHYSGLGLLEKGSQEANTRQKMSVNEYK